MRVMLGGGGTGGHVYPALSVLEALRRPPFSVGPDDVLYVGSAGRSEATLAPHAGVPFHAVMSGAVVERGLLGLLASAFRNLAGTVQAAATIRRFRPNVVFATGGYVSVPVVLAAWLLRVPALVYLPDAKPGLAVRVLSRFATKVGTSVPEAAALLPAGKTVLTGYPVRTEFTAVHRDAARAQLGVGPDEAVVLVVGGSLGSHALNQVVAGNLRQLLTLCKLIHLAGPEAAVLQQARSQLPQELRDRYYVHEYLHQGVAEAMAAADLAVCRAGASVLGELPVAALPAILVPYPHSGAHQQANAEALANQGAAVVLRESDAQRLPALITSLLSDAAARHAMVERLRAIARPDAAQALAGLLSDMAIKPSRRAGTVGAL